MANIDDTIEKQHIMKVSNRLFFALPLLVLTACTNADYRDVLLAEGAAMTGFRTTSVEKVDGATVRHSVYIAHNYKVEKVETIREFAEWGMTTYETFYINQGVDITVSGYESQHTAFCPADTLVWSLQPTSSEARLDWVLPVVKGTERENYLWMNNSDYGGGIPMIDFWERNGGQAIGLTEKELRGISMPIRWTGKGIEYYLSYTLPEPMVLHSGDTLRTYNTFSMKHEGDYFNALRAFSEYMQSEQGVKMQPSEPEAFEPVWCAWGYERTFTIDEVIGTLDKVAELGFRWVDVDDGYQIAEGDWETNSRFPGGDKDMRRLTDEIHRRGMLAKLWWAPLAADPDTRILREHPELMLVQEDGTPENITWWDSYYLSPVNTHTTAYSNNLVERFLKTWGFDGLKIDGQHLNCCMPDYNPASGLDYPGQAPEQMPTYFEGVYEKAHEIKPEAVIQVCPCGCAMNYFILPHINQAVASDPTSSKQVRMKRRAYAAMVPDMAYYGDHVELTDGGCDFASQIGTGSVIGTKFTYPKDNPNASESFLLTEEKEALIRHWMKIFKEKDLVHGEYVGDLYSWGYDYPETHVIRQNGAMYYAFYADTFEGQIELRGLEKNKEYEVTEYTAQEPRTFRVSGKKPVVEANFEKNYLIEVRELGD